MPLLFILMILHEYTLSKVNSQSASRVGKIVSRLSYIFDYIDHFYPEELTEAISKIKSFLETTISVEIGWILFAVVAVVAVVVVVLKPKNYSK
jgi:type II secretory pathway component PulF